MTYYVNPMVFYLVEVSDNIASLMGIVAFLLGFYAVAALLWVIIDNDFMEDEKQKRIIKNAKKSAILCFVCGALIVLIPSKETCYQMLIASEVTVENVGKAQETIKEVADYIVEAADKIANGSKEE